MKRKLYTRFSISAAGTCGFHVTWNVRGILWPLLDMQSFYLRGRQDDILRLTSTKHDPNFNFPLGIWATPFLQHYKTIWATAGPSTSHATTQDELSSWQLCFLLMYVKFWPKNGSSTYRCIAWIGETTRNFGVKWIQSFRDPDTTGELKPGNLYSAHDHMSLEWLQQTRMMVDSPK